MSTAQLTPPPRRRSLGVWHAVALFVVIAGSLLACIFDQSDYNGGGRRTERPGLVDPDEEDESCVKGSCRQICGTQLGDNVIGEDCKCSGGKCIQTCGPGSLCTCSGGGCEQACDFKTKCTCSGGGCRQECPADSGVCTCTGGNCTCNGPGCIR